MATITRDTSSYNSRRYGKPWIARVDFSTNPRGEFEWGLWVGDAGDAGMLIVEANEGDIVALGQKDFRKPANSAPEWYQFVTAADGELTLAPLGSRADAYRLSTANK